MPASPVETAVALLRQGEVSKAIERLQQLLRSDPHDSAVWTNLAIACQTVGRLAEAVDIYRVLVARVPPPLRWRIASNLLVCLQYQPGLGDLALKREAESFGSALGAPEDLPWQAASRPGPLRVGLISADLCDHPVGLLLLPLLRHLDRSLIEPVLFSAGGPQDLVSGEIRSLAEWHDVAGLADDALLVWLRRHRLDLMVDLSGHTAGNRLPVLARRVAPVQVSWLGYFATTGIPAMDHVLMDRHTVPDGSEANFTERVARMQGHRFCYEPAVFAPEVSSLPSLRAGRVTFGSFNNTSKYNAAVFDLWATLLKTVPGSRLVLKWVTFADPAYRQSVAQHFSARGVDPARLEFRGVSPHAEMLAQYADIDIALDPFPFSGGYTTCEALWMGVPVITFPSSRPISRQSLGIISSLERPDWAAQWVAVDASDYVAKAAALARDLPRLTGIRASLREAAARSAFTDGARFAREWTREIRRLAGR